VKISIIFVAKNAEGRRDTGLPIIGLSKKKSLMGDPLELFRRGPDDAIIEQMER